MDDETMYRAQKPLPESCAARWAVGMNVRRQIHLLPEAYVVGGICLAALLLRLAFSFVVFPRLAGPLGLGTDPDYFGQLAQNWAAGNGYTFHPGDPPTTFRGPGYPAALVIGYRIFGDMLLGAILIQCLMGAALCAIVYLIGKRVFGPRVGLTAAALVAIHPLLIWYSPRYRYENLLSLLLALCVYWFLRTLDSRSYRDAILTGLWLGMAVLVNQMAALLLLVLLSALPLFGAGRVRAVRLLTVTALTMALTILPWTIRNYQVSGRFILAHSGGVTQFFKGNLEYEYYDEAPLQLLQLERAAMTRMAEMLGIEWAAYDERHPGMDEAVWPFLLADLRHGRVNLIAKIVAQAPRFWYLSESPAKSYFLAAIQGGFLVLTLFGAFRVLRDERRGIVFILIIGCFNLVYAATHSQARYATPIVPYVVILAAAGLAVLCGVIRKP